MFSSEFKLGIRDDQLTYMQTFHDVMKIMFKGLPGQKRITQNEYEVTEDSEGTLIQDSDWESKVLPGVRISMAITITTSTSRNAVRSELAAHKCSRCSTPNSGATPVKGYIKWYASNSNVIYLMVPGTATCANWAAITTAMDVA